MSGIYNNVKRKIASALKCYKESFFKKDFRLGKYEFSIEDFVSLTFVFLLLCFVCLNIIELLKIDVWRHDSIYYHNLVNNTDSCYYRMLTEGRWLSYRVFAMINYLLPPQLHIVIFVFAICFFCYHCAKRLTKNTLFSLCFSLVAVQSHAFWDLIFWCGWDAVTSFVLIAAVLLSKLLPVKYFFPIIGILCFGEHFTFYNLMPMLYIAELKDKQKFIKVMLFWCFGFILGLVVAELWVLLDCGHLITPGAWRRPQPITCFYDIFRNFAIEYEKFVRGLNCLLKNKWTGISLIVPVVFGLCSFYISKRYRDKDYVSAMLFRSLLCIAISLSMFVQDIPYGTCFILRTTYPLYIGILMLLVVVCYSKNLQALFIVCFMFAGFSLWQSNFNDIKYYQTVMRVWKSELEAICPNSQLYKGIKIYMTNDDVRNAERIIAAKTNRSSGGLIEGLGMVYRWIPVVKELGFTNIEVYYYDVLPPVARNKLYSYEEQAGWLCVGINQAFLNKASTIMPKVKKNGRKLFENGEMTIYIYDQCLYYVTSVKHDNTKKYFLRLFNGVADDDKLNEENRSYDFEFSAMQLTPTEDDQEAVAEIPLPLDYEISFLETGQLADSKTHIWLAKINVK